MISNKRQYATSKAELKKFEASLAELKQQNTSPYTNETINGVVIGMHVIDSRIDENSERIPLRVLFHLASGKLFEHIFRADWIEVEGLKRVNIGNLVKNPKLVQGQKLTEVEITTRPDSQAKWDRVSLMIGTPVDLTVRGIHQRINYNTGLPFGNESGQQKCHAKYCYIGKAQHEVSLPI